MANQSTNTLSVINTATNAITATVSVGSQPISLAINSAGTLVYVGNATSSNISVVNTSTNTVTATIANGTSPNGLVLSAGGQYLYAASTTANQIRVYDAASGNALVGTFASASSRPASPSRRMVRCVRH